MPIINRNDAADVERAFRRIFQAPAEQRAHELRRLFAEVLDFNTALGDVPLTAASPAAANPALPANAERIAQLDGVQALYVPLQHAPIDGRRDADRVRKQDVVAAARRIADRLGDDMLLVFANRSASQLHLIYPNFAGAQPTLRRMVVERGIPQRTAVQQVANIYWNYRDTGSIRQALDNAFDVDPVTKQFFTEYHRIFNEVERSIQGFGAGDAERDAKRTFTQTLFNRLMFIYFMSRKRWLAINHDRDYLNALWRDYAAADGEQKNFYIDRLRPLFFAGLNNPKSQDHTHHDSARELIGDVPFLNGGLFEQTDLDRRAETGGDDAVTVPDDALRRIMTDLFDKFNFTVQESTPYDVEVAVDPEMLGKVFEELVNDRHGSGSYYTPRAVVSFMCREALKGYLAGRDAALAPAAIAKFIDERDASGIPLADARRVGEALAAVAVVDPACGSGAYLLGMMQELVELQTALYNAGVDPKSLYELKLDIIQRNLYGVDNSDFAVNIAMLRMWLSLAIDYDGERPEPLPNLDLKLVCGDSLLGPDPSAAAYGDLFRALTDSRNLGAAKADYMRATHGDEKRRLKTQILDIQRELQDALGDAAVPENIVDWRIAFAEVFADAGGGFDVVIANPPYINVESLKSEIRRYLLNNYSACRGRTDIYIAFMQRALSMLSEQGLMTFIIPSAFTAQKYAAEMRKILIDRHHIRQLVDSSHYRIFENAVVYNIVLSVEKQQSDEATRIRHHYSNSDFESPADDEILVDQQFFATLKDARLDTNPPTQAELDIRNKVWRSSVRLDEICLVAYGARLNGKSNGLRKNDYKSAVQIGGGKPFCEGRNIERYTFSQDGWLNYKPDEHYNSMFPELFENKKLMFINIVKDNLRFAYDDSGFYNSHTVINCVRLDLLVKAQHTTAVRAIKKANLEIAKEFDYKFLLGVLNSQAVNWYFTTFLSEGLHFYPDDAKQLPIPKISRAEQRPFIRLVDQILAAKRADTAADTRELEWRLDELVYALYGLTEAESTAIERSLGLIHATDAAEDAALGRAMAEALAEPGERVGIDEIRRILRGQDGT